MVDNKNNPDRGSRCIALVGPYLSGKTTLLEALLIRSGAHVRNGLDARHLIGDTSPEAREHGMSVELNAADIEFLGDAFSVLDCPGSVEFQYDAAAALTVCDMAVVVCEADEKKLPHLQIILKDLEDRQIPHLLFLNKVDKSAGNIRETLTLLQRASSRPLVLRQIPIVENGVVSGFIDLALERAYHYRKQAASELVAMPEELTVQEATDRFAMLESLADYDDELMEQLLGDVAPARDKVFDDLVSEMKRGQICPVLFGSAENGNGVGRLLKVLRHEAPFVEETAARLGVGASASCAHVFKTYHTSHAGKLSFARVLCGTFADGDAVSGPDGEDRIAGVFSLIAGEPKKRGPAHGGDTVAFGRLESVASTMTVCTEKGKAPKLTAPKSPQPVYGLGLVAGERKDEIKLTAALSKLIDEDPSYKMVHDADVNQLILWGQGEMHLRVALERLARRFNIQVQTHRRTIAYKETIRKNVEIRGRQKKQSGGHGQFGDVVLELEPRPRGEGFAFSEMITGGVVPRQFFSSVEAGVRDALEKGPLGFPVVDVAACLKDGSYHSVDSSDQAFRAAGRIAVTEGLPKCSPVLLEPILAVEIAVPAEVTPKINAMIAQRRGQILGFDARADWPGWDVIDALIPDAETADMIVELRSVSAGAGSFAARFDHLAELSGKLADTILAQHSSAA